MSDANKLKLKFKKKKILNEERRLKKMETFIYIKIFYIKIYIYDDNSLFAVGFWFFSSRAFLSSVDWRRQCSALSKLGSKCRASCISLIALSKLPGKRQNTSYKQL